MKCEGAENGGPCLRCARSGHECIFLESNRGRKSDKRRKTAAMQQGLKKVEQLLVPVLQNMHGVPSMGPNAAPAPVHLGLPVNLGLPTEMHASPTNFAASPLPKSSADIGISPAAMDMLAARVRQLVASEGLNGVKGQSARIVAEQAAKFMQQMGMLDETLCSRLMDSSNEDALRNMLEKALNGPEPSPAAAPGASAPEMSTMHMPLLPDNTLNPLGLFAEASLQNLQRSQMEGGRNSSGQRRGRSSTTESTGVDGSTSSVSPGDTEAVSSDDPRPQYGLANETYFHLGLASAPRTSENGTDAPPELLTENVVSSDEVLELFRIFFQHCSLHMFLLDPEWHTPTLVCQRSSFLFTCVCAVASKFYTRRPELYSQCQRRAVKNAFEVMSRGCKSPEIVQGFLLLTLYNQPVEWYEEDRTWLFAGVAIRMAQDLNLHRKNVMPPEAKADEAKMRDVLNRERTWYICFCVDRTLSAQMGKPYSIREDFLIRHASEWCIQPFSRPWDLGICALVDLLRVQTRQLDFLYSSTVTPSGLNVDLDYPAILPSFNEQLNETMQFWYRLGLDTMTRTWAPIAVDRTSQSNVAQPPQPDSMLRPGEQSKNAEQERSKERERAKAFMPAMHSLLMDPANSAADTARVSMLLALHEAGPPSDDADLSTRSMYYIARQAPLRYNYAVLVLNSFGLQYALERPSDGASADKPQYLVRCVHAAKEIIATVKYGMREILRYAPDPTFVAVAYACVFLLKLIRPTFAKYINEEEVIALVNYTIEVLEEAAVDKSHTPALYASFLRTLVQSRHEQKAQQSSGSQSEADAVARTPSDPMPMSASLPGDASAHHDPKLTRQMDGQVHADPSLVAPRSPAMTVNPLQVNPMAAELAANEGMRSKSSLPPSELELDHAAPPPLPVTLDAPHTSLHDLPPSTTAAHDQFSNMHGWDAMQYAKAQGVEVNRVLDNSFWTSLLPPGYGSGVVSHASTFELNRDSDLFKVSSQGPRMSVTPGATRASSPTLMHANYVS
ncbi:hypothetical protein MCAP1_000521 [Malassezia caprae]|uniref:Xylanolytic transcriptional activator regulatory domain-containing protein n=1 Tax=Malassezia caprae TaxID=1381934 RepID=A0AAF0E3N9_9BASI|nr:hypothetical protein MCAP1_000521 [Malassezia caprae]